jgi:diadenosine tetraphosphatase ApaH/serine/threonine PP2A family protein phosphatase
VRPMLGLLYDIHGNLTALDAVLDDCPAERLLLGGDYALGGPWPVETIARLDELDAEWIRGNTDRWLVDDSDAPEPVHAGLAAGRELLGDELVQRLASLEAETTRDDTLFCHASPGSDMVGFEDEPSDEDSELVRGVEQRRVVFGHTHIQFERTTPEGIQLVNPGSVGMPFDHDHRAAYALLHDDGRVELRRVEYDWRPVGQLVRERMGEPFASRLEQARFDVIP